MVRYVIPLLMDDSLRFTRHFLVREFFVSETADEKKIFNIPYTWQKLREVLRDLSKLAQFLELLRSCNGNKPIYVTSGFRCKELNTAVGGNPFSKHMDGRAVDITSADFDYLCDSIDWLDSKEFTWIKYPEKRYIHVQFKKSK